MTNIQDFIYTFPGFWNESKCHIRIINKPGLPIFIICSQIPGHTGTSVTNAFETIYTLMHEKIQNDYRNYKKRLLSETIGEYRNLILETKSILKSSLIFILGTIEKSLVDKNNILKLISSPTDIIWIENWPKGTALHYDHDIYRIVIPYAENGPVWQTIDPEIFCEHNNILLSEFLKEEAIFEPFYTEEIREKINRGF